MLDDFFIPTEKWQLISLLNKLKGWNVYALDRMKKKQLMAIYLKERRKHEAIKNRVDDLGVTNCVGTVDTSISVR